MNKSNQQQSKIKLGIIGVGNIGTAHVESILSGLTPEIQIAAVADRNESRRAWAQSVLPANTPIFTEGSELIASGVCDSVILCVPHYQHPPLAIEGFSHGLHVISEKPVGVYTLAVREMIAAADAHPELTFAVMFNQRTNCLYRKIKELLVSGEAGTLKRVSWIVTDWYRPQKYYDSGAWRASWEGEGGGVLMNQSPHQLDLLQWLCGMPETVTAFCHNGKWHDIEVEDDVTAYFEYACGATGTFITSTGDAPGTNRLEITGSKGTILCDGKDLTFLKLSKDEREFCKTAESGFAHPDCETIHPQTDGQNLQHVGVLNAFAAHILHGTPLIADGREGINGLTLANAMYLSSWTHQTIRLPLDEELFLRELNKRRATSRLRESNSVYTDTKGSYGA